MINFSSVVTCRLYRYVTVSLLSILLSGSLFVCIPKNCSWNFSMSTGSSHCSAKSVLSEDNTTVTKAVSLSIDTIYQNKIDSGSTQYYCLLGQQDAGYILITIQAQELPSFSFQLFDQETNACSPAAYQYEPETKTLQIKYYFSSRKNYLLGLSNLLTNSNSYTIKYEAMQESKEQKTTKKPKFSKPKATKKPKLSNPTQKQSTVSKPNTVHSKTNTTVSKPNTVHSKTNATVLKPNTVRSKARTTVSKQKNTNKQNLSDSFSMKNQNIQLSNTFLQVSCGKSIRLSAKISPKEATETCQWYVSENSFITGKQIQKHSDKTIFSAKTRKKGILIITCRNKKNLKISASCTIKISS